MPKPRKGKLLTDKEEAFCREYVVSWNGTRAAIDAGYAKKNADVTASQNLRKPRIQERIKQLMSEKVMSQEEVLARLAAQARASHYPFIEVDSDGFVYFNFSDPDALRHLHLIKKIKTKRQRQVHGRGEDAETWEGEWVEVELHDAQKALELIGKRYNLFVDRDKEGNPIQPVVNVYIPRNERDDDGSTGDS